MAEETPLMKCEICGEDYQVGELLKISIFGERYLLCKDCAGEVKMCGRMEEK